MLTEKEQFHASELLSGLQFDDLKDLAKTVTHRANLPVPQSKEEAIGVIVRYEDDPESLLRRKKVTRPLLSHYLHFKNIKFDVNDDLPSLYRTVINFWRNSPEVPLSIEAKPAQCNDVSVPVLPSHVDEMSHQFSSWFYGLLNEEFWKRGGEILGPQHLFSDCTVTVKSMTDQTCEQALESEAGSQLLRTVASQVLFQPATVVAKPEVNGAVAVAVSGTLHKLPDNCVGAFRQAFSLVADPFADGNWKIKQTELHLAADGQGPLPLDESVKTNVDLPYIHKPD